MPKCGNCGSTLIRGFTTKGERIYICPHIQPRITKTGIARLVNAEFWCDMRIGNPKLPVETVHAETKAEIAALKAQQTYQSLVKSTSALLMDAYTKDMHKNTYELIDKNTLLKSVNLALLLNLPYSQIPTLFNASIKLGLAVSRPPTNATEDIIKAIGRETIRILDNLGITFKRSEIPKGSTWKETAIAKTIEKASLLPEPTTEQISKIKQTAHEQNAQIDLGEKLLK